MVWLKKKWQNKNYKKTAFCPAISNVKKLSVHNEDSKNNKKMKFFHDLRQECEEPLTKSARKW